MSRKALETGEAPKGAVSFISERELSHLPRGQCACMFSNRKELTDGGAVFGKPGKVQRCT